MKLVGSLISTDLCFAHLSPSFFTQFVTKIASKPYDDFKIVPKVRGGGGGLTRLGQKPVFDNFPPKFSLMIIEVFQSELFEFHLTLSPIAKQNPLN